MSYELLTVNQVDFTFCPLFCFSCKIPRSHEYAGSDSFRSHNAEKFPDSLHAYQIQPNAKTENGRSESLWVSIQTDQCVYQSCKGNGSLAQGIAAGALTALSGGRATNGGSGMSTVRTNLIVLNKNKKIIGSGDYMRSASGMQADCEAMMVKTTEWLDDRIFEPKPQ